MFNLVLTQVLKALIQAITNLIVDAARNADAADVGQCFDAGGDIYALAMDVLAVVHDVAKIDPHAEIEGTCRQSFLHDDGTLDGILDGCEFSQETVTRQFDDAARVSVDGGADDVSVGGLPSGDGAVCILLDEPGVACDISGQDGR